MNIKFIGAAQTVTGSKHLITTESNKQFLLDCGLFQGLGEETDNKNRQLGFNPMEIDFMILSHAHIDHCGNIPLLVKQGFTGKIYCSDATADLAEIMLTDSAKIHQSDVKFINKHRIKQGREPYKPLYTEEDVKQALQYFSPLPLKKWIALSEEVSVYFTDAGHILGSVVTNLKIKKKKGVVRLTYSGDIGRYNDYILKSPAPFPQADYIICESTYGNRLHEEIVDAETKLVNTIHKTCVEQRGKVIIPAFSLGRTQELVYTLDKLNTEGKLPQINVFVDSPLSVNATNIMRKHPQFFNKDILNYMKKDSDPFGFSRLHYIKEVEESKALNFSNEPCIIISASGMAEAGRIKHHIMNNIENTNNTILIVGYCTPESLGGRLASGKKNVKIFGDEYSVLANVEVISSYSAHADYSEIIKFLSGQKKEKIKRIFLVHGEKNVQLEFKGKLITEGFNEVSIPMEGESFKL